MFRRTFIISALVMTLAGTAAMAQGLRGKKARRGGSPTQRLERLQQKLSLNETQMSGVRGLDETRRKEMESLRGEFQQKRQGLRQLMRQTNPNPTEVGNATLALKEEREKEREINQRFMSGVKGLLTPDQLQNFPKRLR